MTEVKPPPPEADPPDDVLSQLAVNSGVLKREKRKHRKDSKDWKPKVEATTDSIVRALTYGLPVEATNPHLDRPTSDPNSFGAGTQRDPIKTPRPRRACHQIR